MLGDECVEWENIYVKLFYSIVVKNATQVESY